MDSKPMAAISETALARGLLRPSLRRMPGTDMAASTVMDSQPMAMAVTAMARGLLRPSLRLMSAHRSASSFHVPGTDMVVVVASTATDSQPMVPMAIWDTALWDTARGLLRPSLKLMPGTDMAVWDTAMARGLLMLRPSLRLMPGTDMVASTAMDSQLMVMVMEFMASKDLG